MDHFKDVLTTVLAKLGELIDPKQRGKAVAEAREQLLATFKEAMDDRLAAEAVEYCATLQDRIEELQGEIAALRADFRAIATSPGLAAELRRLRCARRGRVLIRPICYVSHCTDKRMAQCIAANPCAALPRCPNTRCARHTELRRDLKQTELHVPLRHSRRRPLG
jgi:hypothetical protein